MRSEANQNKFVDINFSPTSAKFELSGVSRKRSQAADKVFAFVTLTAIFPVLTLLGLLIALGGQRVLFLQERIGYAGKPFLIFKFRTIPDGGWDLAEREVGNSQIARLRLNIFKKVSRVLRTTGLDELPQFVNVFKGDMQIIGPRPLVFDDFVALPEGRMERCAVPPGITGLAQVNGGQDLDAASKLALDVYVIDHLSFGMWAKIVWRTVFRIVRGAAATANADADDLARARMYMCARGLPSPVAARQGLFASATKPQRPIYIPALDTQKTAPVALHAEMKDIRYPMLESR